jgi:hypothetical protein
MGLAEVLQMYCAAKRTGMISFVVGETTGAVYLQHGQILHALSAGFEGESACYDMLMWGPGAFQFDESYLPDKRTVVLTWEQLIFEGARRADLGLAPDEQDTNGAPLPVVTTPPEKVINTRIQGGVPKLTIIEGKEELANLLNASFELEREYTHLGRIEGNDIVLPAAAVSSRHCMFCLSGSDVIVRDMNSANGTFVNGEQVGEAILQLGDIIQVGPVVLKFESGVRRPKLNVKASSGGAVDGGAPPLRGGQTLKVGGVLGSLKAPSTPAPASAPAPAPQPALSRKTGRLGAAASEPAKNSTREINRSYVTGQKAIQIGDLQPTSQPKNASPLPYLFLAIGILSALAIGVYYFMFMSK